MRTGRTRTTEDLPDLDLPVELFENSTGEANASLGQRPIHSRRAAVTEARRFIQSVIESIQKQKPAKALILGLGTDHVLAALLEHPDLGQILQTTTVDLYEPITALRSRTQARISEPLDPLPAGIRWLMPGPMPHSFQLFVFPFYARAFPELLEKFQSDVNRNTIQTMLRLWKRNFWRRTQNKVSLLQRFADGPLIFVGASPELESHLDWLIQWNKDRRGLLISSDTALPRLLAAGIKPHFYLSVDASPATAYHLLACPFQDVPALTWSGGPGFLSDFGEEHLYRSDFPLETGWKGQPISNPLGNLAGLAIALASCTSSRKLLLLASEGARRNLQSHCRNTGYEYYAKNRQSRLNAMDTYFFRLYDSGYKRSQDTMSKQEELASRLGVEILRLPESLDLNGIGEQSFGFASLELPQATNWRDGK
ncbi:MAG: DUF115 domain-containing protein [Leptospiraceae bacterium]|nr:DUF115 domain-containing protein [Leptospiraceae bacterium]